MQTLAIRDLFAALSSNCLQVTIVSNDHCGPRHVVSSTEAFNIDGT